MKNQQPRPHFSQSNFQPQPQSQQIYQNFSNYYQQQQSQTQNKGNPYIRILIPGSNVNQTPLKNNARSNTFVMPSRVGGIINGVARVGGSNTPAQVNNAPHDTQCFRPTDIPPMQRQESKLK